MLGATLRAGYQPTPNEDEADYIVVNTCGFLRRANTSIPRFRRCHARQGPCYCRPVRVCARNSARAPASARAPDGRRPRRAARDESLETIGELAARRKPGARLVVAGCMAGGLYRSEIEAAHGHTVRSAAFRGLSSPLSDRAGPHAQRKEPGGMCGRGEREDGQASEGGGDRASGV